MKNNILRNLNRRSNSRRKLIRSSDEVIIDLIEIDFENFDIGKVYRKIIRILKFKTRIEEPVSRNKNLNFSDYIGEAKVIVEKFINNSENVYSLKIRFIEISKKYIKIDIKNRNEDEIMECICGRSYDNFIHVERDIYKCDQCECEQEIIIENKERLLFEKNKNKNNLKEGRKNISEAFDRYCGRIEINFDIDQLLEKIDQYMVETGNITSEDAMELEKKANGTKEGTHLTIIGDALKDLGFSVYYNFSMVIAHRYWGWSYDNIYYVKEDFLKIYDKIQMEFNNIPPHIRRRSSNLPVEYTLFKILQLMRFDCNIKNFKFSKNTNTLNDLDRIWEIICNNCRKIYFYPTR